MQRTHVVLNFDTSTGLMDKAQVIDLQTWQEAIRFGCSWKKFRHLAQYLHQQLPAFDQLGCVLMGSGDYHHVTQLLLSRLSTPLHLIICDNHPDNMRYPFGIHCGSWVYWASRLPHIKRIDVLGICSADISLKHAWENHWAPLRQGKLHYWSIGQDASWTKWIGAGKNWHQFDTADALLNTFLTQLETLSYPRYLSIDKDVLSVQEVRTNWDQGQFLYHHLEQLIQACHGQLIAADITGDISAYDYQSHFKRFLSASDGQTMLTQQQILQWQSGQAKINQQLIQQLEYAFQ
ncbi:MULTISPECIES: hypothetical protein [unclassified Acinetobacter]|uniref:hypothetical protein n=1 Tax=unclassified Acinetobacter TaxID=196816 RepID=UPI0029344E5E|nr:MULTISPECIES: hypothetical protein [unclassified Acinetobacter]WOE31858.1 hypothetical protein QSG84_01135 [Acinetobacter sp. SAAs470]WOE37325.1 hypothetical protein QSG86_10180 [Acinetobacter sp. SAAs474]